MPVPKFLRKLFGASDPETDEVEFDDFDDKPHAPKAPSDPEPAPASANTQVSIDEMPPQLFNAILEVINSQLPPIAAQCIDHQAQLRYLNQALQQPMADFAKAIKAQVISELTGDRKKMQAELDTLRSERSKLDEQKASLLSEQRQRRALTERNHDLESKIDELDSEIEQHKLTISSLMNKLRVAEVTEGDTEALRRDLEEMRMQIAAKDETIASKDAEIAALNERISEMESGKALEASLEQRREAAGETDKEIPAAPRRKRGRPRKNSAAYAPADSEDSSALLESVDWLLPGGAPVGHVGHVSDPDFGYQPPKQAPEPDPDTQLTLF